MAMPDEVSRKLVLEVDPLKTFDRVGPAARRVVNARLPALPVVDADGRYAGIFGEREFMTALFPGYVRELGSTAMIRRSLDDAIDRRLECAQEPVSSHMTTDHVAVEDGASDTQIAELFLHHRVVVLPVTTGGRVHGVITRSAFFAALVKRVAPSD